VRVSDQVGDTVTAMLHFATFRTKNRDTQIYPGSARYRLRRVGDGLRISEKRVVLDLDALIPQGKLSIIL
jgi:3-phenylpropionate/cinnamic acid dioxygenase small subunit